MPGAARSSASSSWVRSRSCASSTSRCAHRPRQRPARAASASRRPSARTTRSSKSTPPSSRDRPLVGDERARDRARRGIARHVVGGDAEVQLEAREGEVQPAAVRPAPPPGTARAGARRGRRAARSGCPASASISRPERVERPDPDRPGGKAEGRQRGVQPVGSSSAARLLNATTHTDAGSAPPSTSHATRATSVVVLPDPPGRRTAPVPAAPSPRPAGRARAGRGVRRPRGGP